MTETLYSRRAFVDLAELSWENLNGAIDQWPRLFALLSALEAEHAMLGNIEGTLEVALGTIDQPTLETWPIAVLASSVAALREQVEASTMLPRPLEATLHCAPVVLLPDDHLQIIDFDSIEQYSRGQATLAPASNMDRTDGLTPWRIAAVSEKSSLLYFDVSFGTPSFADGVTVWARSRCDLWLPARLDGEPNVPHGPANAHLLAECIERIVHATGAQVS